MDSDVKRPPKLAQILLKRLSPPHLAETALGDFDELFSWKAEEIGTSRAKLWYWKQALQSILLSFYWAGILLNNYLKIAWRNVKRHKLYSFINIAGMAMGIACCILILLWVHQEMSWDRFHEHANEIYLVSQKQYDGHLTPVTPAPLATFLKAEFPEVKNAARYMMYSKLQLKYGDKSFSEDPIIVDSAFFQIFSYDFIKGIPDTALNGSNSILITEELAAKFFGQDNPLGKTITVNNRTDFEVKGVIKSVPRNSTFQFDCVLPFQLIAQGRSQDNWRNSYLWTYVQLQSNSPYRDFNQKIAGSVKQHDPENEAELNLQPLTQLHLRPQEAGGPIIYVYIFSAMAIFILVIACINFINLTTARSANRAKEVGLRKVIGAKITNLIRQFFGESFLFSFAAVSCAVLLVFLFLPTFNNLSGKQFTFGQDIAHNIGLILGIIGIAIFTGAFSGFYPAFLLSSFQPAQVLRASQKGGRISRSPMFRRILVVVQFSRSIFLMIGTFIIYSQLNFIRTRNLGFNKNHVVCSDSSWGEADVQTIKDELLTNPNIQSVSFASQKMGEWESGAREDVKWKGRASDLKITFEVIFCDHDYLETHKMEMVQGRFFSKEFPGDERQSFVLNETAVKEMGFGDGSPVGESLSFWEQYNGTIVGVIKDFHTQSLHNRIQPVIMAYNPGSLDNINIRLGSEDMTRTLMFIQEKWRELTGGFSFEYSFLDESLDERYRAEKATGPLLKSFTFLAILISCIGLLGLISFIAQQRTKEIGIRKVLGAPVFSILKFLVKEFMLLVLLANIIAWPVAYFAAKKWLENFAYQTDIVWTAFFFSGGLALIIALLTVGLQSLKAATANPVESLRYE